MCVVILAASAHRFEQVTGTICMCVCMYMHVHMKEGPSCRPEVNLTKGHQNLYQCKGLFISRVVSKSKALLGRIKPGFRFVAMLGLAYRLENSWGNRVRIICL